MHTVAIRKDVHQRDPSVAGKLYAAFCESKRLARERMRHLGALRYMLPWMQTELDEIDEVFGGDPWPYGVEANRATLETLVQLLAEQSIIKAPVPVDELFVPVRGDLT